MVSMQQDIPLSSLTISGPDAATFLQGQLTCDVLALADNEKTLGACCEPNGRMIANFYLIRKGEQFNLILPASMIETLLTHLKKFAVFSKVTLTHSDENITNLSADLSKLNTVFIVPETSRLFIPQMINLEKAGGVSFAKGCYVGQEIIARTQHLGKLKRHLQRFSIRSDAIPLPGDALYDEKNDMVGTVCASMKNEDNSSDFLAVIQDAAIKNNSPIYTQNKFMHACLRARLAQTLQ